MHKLRDPYTYFEEFALSSSNTNSGSVQREFAGSVYDNVQMCDLSSVGQVKSSRKYRLELTQRLRLCNVSNTNFANPQVYENYPVILISFLQFNNNNAITNLISYSPQTVNTKVETAGSQGDSAGQTTAVTLGMSNGSTQSQTNSFGASVSVSMEGPSTSANFEHSETESSEQSKSYSNESGSSSGHEHSSTASMSMKDWGSYAQVSPNGPLTWTFGQEYPWDAIRFRQFTGPVSAQQQLQIPAAVTARLYDPVSNCLYPPSHLSVFGFDFVMKSMWILEVPNGQPETLDVENRFSVFTASHIASNSVAVISRDVQPTDLQIATGAVVTTTIDIALLALDPIGVNSSSAVIGFSVSSFTIAPVAPTTPVNFSIFSGSNQLIARDTTQYNASGTSGFAADDHGLICSIDPENDALTVRLFLKIINSHQDYTLFFKHWALTDVPVIVNVTINGTQTIQKLITSLEAEGGENNITAIKLRELDFGSPDYHDYLQLGLNTVDISISMSQAPSQLSPVYKIAALSIE